MGGGRGKAVILQNLKKIVKKIFFYKTLDTNRLLCPKNGDSNNNIIKKNFWQPQGGGKYLGPMVSKGHRTPYCGIYQKCPLVGIVYDAVILVKVIGPEKGFVPSENFPKPPDP